VFYLDADSDSSSFWFGGDVINSGSFVIENDNYEASLIGIGFPYPEFQGNPIIYNGKTVSFDGNFTYEPDVVLAAEGDAISLASGSKIYFNDISIGVSGAASSFIVNGNASFYVGGDFDNTTTGIFDCGEGTAYFDSDSPDNIIKSTGASFYNMVLSSSSGDGVWTMVDDLTINNNFTLNSGTLTIPDPKDPDSLLFSVGRSFTINGGMFDRYTGDGSSVNPYIVRDIYDLQAIKCHTTSGLYFLQDRPLIASSTSTWNAGKGFVPIGGPTV